MLQSCYELQGISVFFPFWQSVLNVDEEVIYDKL